MVLQGERTHQVGRDLSTKFARQCRWRKVLSSLVMSRDRQECLERLGTGTRLWIVCSWMGFLQHCVEKSGGSGRRGSVGNEKSDERDSGCGTQMRR